MREEVIQEQNIEQKRKEHIVDCLAFSSITLFILSPLIQIIREYIAPHKETPFGPIRTYPLTINLISIVVMAVAIILWALRIVSIREHVKSNSTEEPHQGNKYRPFIPYIIFFALAVWICISQAVNGFTDVAMNGDSYRNESLMTFVLYLLGYFFLGTMLRSDRLRKSLCVTFLGSNLIVGILVLVDYFAVNLRIFDDSDGMAAIFNQFNHYGYYLLMAMLLSATWFVVSEKGLGLHILCTVVYITDTVILILNNTFGCYLAVIAALLFCAVIVFTVRRNRGEILRLLIVIVTFALIVIIMYQLNHSAAKDVTKLVGDIENIATDSEKAKYAGTRRWALWTCSVRCIGERPVFGWGIEGIADQLTEATEGVNNRPHNEYLQWAVFFGIPAAVLYLAALCVIMFGMFPRLKKCESVEFVCYIVSAGYIASAFVGNTMYYTAPFFFVFLGMTCRDRVFRNYGKKEYSTGQKENPLNVENSETV